MSIYQSRLRLQPTLQSVHVNLKSTSLALMTVFALSLSYPAVEAIAAGDASAANARYQADRTACLKGQSNQERATCLKEAGAVLQESKMRRMPEGDAPYQQNAKLRCNALPSDDRDACQRRINGEGTTTGSVRDGGIMRELTIPDNK
ncbi:hypothetical protein BH11PSE12_BH11PSE12_32150 [soil metagenome]